MERTEKKSCDRCIRLRLAKACEVCENGASEVSPMPKELYYYIIKLEEKRKNNQLSISV